MAPRIGLLRLGFSTHPTAESMTVEQVRDLRPAWSGELLADRGLQRPADPLTAAIQALDATGDWTPVPLFACAAPPSGPLPSSIFADWRDRIGRLLADQDLDALLVIVDGSLVTTDGEDALAALVAKVRDVVGAEVRIVAAVATATQFAEAAARAVNAVLPARSRHGGDTSATAEQAALVVRLMLAEVVAPTTAYVALPLVWPRTGPAGLRFEALQGQIAQRAADRSADILVAGLVGGHTPPLPGSPGLAVVVTGRRDAATCAAVARDLANLVWEQREQAISPLLPLSAAVALARTVDAPKGTFIDGGDRIDLGSAGFGTELLSALAWAGTEDVLSLGHVDRRVVEQALAAGPGANVHVSFNAEPERASAGTLSTEVEVVAVVRDVPRRQGDPFGRTSPTACLLRLGGICAVVSDVRFLPAEVSLSALDCDLKRFRIVVAKFDPSSTDLVERIPPVVHEIATTGPTAWGGAAGARLYPFDRTVSWAPAPETG